MRYLIAHCILAAILIAGFAACEIKDDPTTSRTTIAIVSTGDPGGSNNLSFMFATNHYVNRVYRINLDNLDVDEIKTGSKPRSIAASPDGRFVACANEESNSITLIGVVSLAKWTVAVGMTPVDLSFSPDGERLAVANYHSGTVVVIDTATRDMSVYYPCTGPSGMDFDDDSKLLAVACYYSDTVQFIDVKEKTLMDAETEDGYEIYERTQVVKFGRDGTNAKNLFFAGFREGPWDEAESSVNYSIAVIDLEENPWDPYFVEAAINPRGFLFNHAGDKLVSIHHGQDPIVTLDDPDSWWTYTYTSSGAYIPGQVSVLGIDEDRNVGLLNRYVVEGNPVAAVLDPHRDLVAVADKENGEVAFIDLDNERQFSVSTETRPYALAFNSSGTKVIVVHETPMMPVSIIDVQARSSKIIFKSLPMRNWIE